MKKVIYTKNAPEPVGPYNQAIEINGMVYTAGQIALIPETGELEQGDVQAQTRQVFENLKAVLEAAETSFDNVVKSTVFLKDMNDFVAMNQIYALYFNEATAPARSTVEVARLPKDVAVEIELIATK